MTYDEFVRGLLYALSPILPEGVSPELSFSGSMDGGRRPGPDMAIVGGDHAVAFLATMALASDIVGVSPDDYKVTYSIATERPLVAHAAYARNLRRWEKGTLPRKRRARAELVVIATCWLCGWEDGHDVDPERMAEAWARVSGLIGDMPADSSDRRGVATALWDLSARTYGESLAAHRKGERTHN